MSAIEYETKAVTEQIDIKKIEIEKDQETLKILTDQKQKKTELYENLKLWNEEILKDID